MKFTGYLPNVASTEDNSTLIIRNPSAAAEVTSLPTPAGPFSMYEQTPEQYLASGQRDFAMMVDMLTQAGVRVETFNRVLEFGCSNSRILRHFEPYYRQSPQKEFWGCDIDADRLLWCEENLSPPFHYFVNTTAPHIPFADHSFDYIYAYSIFTHIDDLFNSWLLELSRILRPGGIMLITIHDEPSIRISRDSPQFKYLYRFVIQHWDLLNALLEGKVNLVSVARDYHSPQVFVRRDYFLRLVQRHMKVLSITEKTMGTHQTAVLMQKL